MTRLPAARTPELMTSHTLQDTLAGVIVLPGTDHKREKTTLGRLMGEAYCGGEDQFGGGDAMDYDPLYDFHIFTGDALVWARAVKTGQAPNVTSFALYNRDTFRTGLDLGVGILLKREIEGTPPDWLAVIEVPRGISVVSQGVARTLLPGNNGRQLAAGLAQTLFAGA